MDELLGSFKTMGPWLGSAPPLLLAAVAAIALTLVGGGLRRFSPGSARALGVAGNLMLVAVFLLAALRFVRLDPTFDSLAANMAMPTQTVEGGETRVPLSADGHYWIEAKVNGTRQRFMVDTGATLTAISSEVATDAGIEPDPLRLPVVVRTANGATEAQMARIGEVRFGSIVARDMDAIVTGTTGGLNVLGMNFLSRLKGWRVEEGVLILTPRHAQADAG
ncbi:TIGR02281 family clan AA aspartic protease [Novosphingobium sp. KCTC 2891]|uniref:retropepsin-like aspartic protease family protein n=1 Tax=Novosphingobium sp. KCTC 2891 TaxID=2989730 RepID=UPI0022221BC0|nr:TIGR02281 family clan AA aspartic protease [Novosphingobium sp. KCTC 2891]MCW1382977.1 TIGR02281 family clan AA aspartic protease [Novosphingobium sp. KCTC 2891]